MKAKYTTLTAYPYPAGIPYGQPNPEIAVEFSETGWRVIKDTRPAGWHISGYLHIEDGLSATEVTDAVRNQIIKYFFNHPDNLPGIGATPQKQYMSDLSIEERESIGNNGNQAFYA